MSNLPFPNKEFSNFISKHLGLSFVNYSNDLLEEKAKNISSELLLKDFPSSIYTLIETEPSQKTIEILAKHFLINESYFFRDSNYFITLEKEILAPLIKQREKLEQPYLRIWSAGCSRGEEAYSIAILLHRLITNINKWNILILATDINIDNLEIAEKAIYNQWSMRDTPKWIDDYFIKKENNYELIPSIKNMVTFKKLNLVKDPYPNFLNNTLNMDLILCKNVFIYFEKKYYKETVDKFYHSLVDNGILSISSVDYLSEVFDKFLEYSIDGIVFYKKTQQHKYDDIYCTDEICIEKHNEILQQDEKQINIYEEIIDTINLLANEGHIELALKKCEKVLKIYNDKIELNYLYGELLSELGLYQKAIKIFQKVLYIDSKYILAHIALANQYNRLDRFDDALRSFNYALELILVENEDTIIDKTDGLTVLDIKQMVNSSIELLNKRMANG